MQVRGFVSFVLYERRIPVTTRDWSLKVTLLRPTLQLSTIAAAAAAAAAEVKERSALETGREGAAPTEPAEPL